MRTKDSAYLSRREQQIMEFIYRVGTADVAAVIAALPDPLSNSAVRTHLRILEEKGHLKHTDKDGKFIYAPTRPRQRAARSALATLLHTFFDDSVEKVMTTLLSERAGQLSDEELKRLSDLIDQTREANERDAGERDRDLTGTDTAQNPKQG